MTQLHLLFLAQRYLIQLSVDYDKKFLNWLRTSCVVSITTVAIWHHRALFDTPEQRIFGPTSNS